MNWVQIQPALPELFLVCAAMALLMLGVFRGERATRAVSWLAVLALVVALALVVMVTPKTGRLLLFADMFAVSLYAGFVKVLVLGAAALGLVMSIGYNEREGIARFEFPVLILLATVGMMLMVSANDLISLYVGLELQSLALYVVAAFRRDSVKSTEAGLKYFVLGALASGMLLYGASLVYGFAGSTNFAQLATVLTAADAGHIGVVIGLVFVMVGLAFKVSAFPFHMWTPDVYEGAPTPVTAFFAAAPKLAAMGLFLSVLVGPFGKLVGQWQQVLVLISIGSMVVGGFAAINQTNIKRLLAYSSIGHVGYALIGLAAGTEDGYRGVLIYMAIYIAMTLGAFAVVIAMRRHGRSVETIADLAGLSKSRPGMALVLLIMMFSMAGIPPFAGFWGKLYVFMAAIDAKLYTLAIVGVLTSVVAAFYYIRIVKLMYFDEPAEAFDRLPGRELGLIQAAAAVFTLFFFLFPGPLVRAADMAVKSIAG
ncbi:MAG: NADH-quinone oxidoreductase subunit NuoN [Rhodospirillaceae bacterium]|nr:NADH-quinone oxidoreductase subunit NuoN [Rhodospirillaceae bacterium]